MSKYPGHIFHTYSNDFFFLLSCFQHEHDWYRNNNKKKNAREWESERDEEKKNTPREN